MRRIPRKIATREDIYNLAMDLPPDVVGPWMATITVDDLRRVGMTDEDWQIMRCRVARSRQLLGEMRRVVTRRVAALDKAAARLCEVAGFSALEAAAGEIERVTRVIEEVGRGK
jgi:hypothetical protein